MKSDLRALGYLEWRQLFNRARHTLRQPARAVLYALVVAYFVVLAIVRQRVHHAFIASVPEPYASALFFAYVTLLGILMYGAASGIVGAFSSAADARFLSGSLIDERLVVLWLQLRRSSGTVVRMIFTLLLYALVFSGSGSLAGLSLSVIAGTIVATGTAIPMLRFRRFAGTRTAQALAGVAAAAGILPMAILLSSLTSWAGTPRMALGIERLGCGYALNALISGRPVALFAFYAAAAGAIALAYAAGRGLYPDLYASSLRVLAFKDRQTRVNAGFAIEHKYEHRGSPGTQKIFAILRGPWTILWKEWIAFVRSPSMQRVFVFGLLACAAVGALFGHLVAASHNRMEEVLELAYTAGNTIVIFVAMGSAVGLSTDIAKPLWWIGRDPLPVRLFAWTVGTSWRLAACIGAGVASWAIALHAVVVAAFGIPLAFTLTLHLRAVGLVIYSLFPSSIDQRGPLALVRALLTYVFAAPPAVAATVVLVLQPGKPALAIGGGIAFSLLETLLLVSFAARRIAGQGVAFARAEAM